MDHVQQWQAPAAGDLDRILRIVRRHWLVVVAGVLLGLVYGLWSAGRSTPQYRASGELFVTSDAGTDVEFLERGLSYESYRTIENEIQLIESAGTRDAIATALGRPVRVDASTTGDDDVVTVSADGPDPESLARDVNDFAAAYVELRTAEARESLTLEGDQAALSLEQYEGELEDVRRALRTHDARRGPALTGERAALQERVVSLERLITETQLESDRVDRAIQTTTGGVEVITEASAPGSPVSPDPQDGLVVAAVGGLGLGLAAAFGRDQLDRRVRTDADADTEPTVPRLAEVPRFSRADRAAGPGLVGRSSPAGEALQRLVTAFDHAVTGRSMRVVEVTSAIDGEGKTTIAACLSEALARSGRRVAVIDADLRRPTLHEMFAMSNDRGLSDLLAGGSTDDRLRVRHSTQDLTVVTAGAAPGSPVELLRSERLAKVIAALADDHELVLIDTPPLLPVADSSVVAQLVDGVVMVTEADRTRADEVTRAMAQLDQVHAELIGTVLTKARTRRGRGYGRYHV